MNQIDIRTHDDVQRLTEAIQDFKEMLLLIYSDTCGHCHTYKPLWDKLHNIKNRKRGLVSVEKNMLPHTPWANVEHTGYPSVIRIDESGVAHPVEKYRDEKNMNSLVNGKSAAENLPEMEDSSSDEEEFGAPEPLSKENYTKLPEEFNTNKLNVLNSQKRNSTTLEKSKNRNYVGGSKRRTRSRRSKKKSTKRKQKNLKRK
jgi:hypothetical protein